MNRKRLLYLWLFLKRESASRWSVCSRIDSDNAKSMSFGRKPPPEVSALCCAESLRTRLLAHVSNRAYVSSRRAPGLIPVRIGMLLWGSHRSHDLRVERY